MDDKQIGQRIDRLEGYVVKALSTLTAVFLCLGAFRTYYTEKGKDYSLVSTVGLFGGSGEEKAIAAGFLGLVLATVAAALVCIGAFDRDQGRSTLRVGTVSFWLMAVGSLVPLLVTLVAANSEKSSEEAGSAMTYYVIGIALFGVLVLSSVRDLWLREPAPGRTSTVSRAPLPPMRWS